MDELSVKIATEWVAYNMRNPGKELELSQFLAYFIRFEAVKKNKPQFQRLTLDQFIGINLKYQDNDAFKKILEMVKKEPELLNDIQLFSKKAVVWSMLVRPFTILMVFILFGSVLLLGIQREWLWLVASVIGLVASWFALSDWMLKKHDECDAKVRDLASKQPGLLEALEDFGNELLENGDQEKIQLLI